MYNSYRLHFKWTISRGRDTYGYNICSLYVDSIKVSSCNGGGYDMQGTCLANWVAKEFKEALLKLDKEFYGLTFHDPNWKVNKKVEERELAGESLGLERYQDFYAQSSKLPTEKHTIPMIAGACGMSSVENILNAIGFDLVCDSKATGRKQNDSYYFLSTKS